MQEINWVLTLEEANAILAVLGDLPTKTGAFPLVIKLQKQCEEQLPPEAVVAE